MWQQFLDFIGSPVFLDYLNRNWYNVFWFIFVILLQLLNREIRKQEKAKQRKTRYQRVPVVHPKRTSAPAPPVAASYPSPPIRPTQPQPKPKPLFQTSTHPLEADLIRLLNGDRPTAKRLVENARIKHPEKSPQWLIEKCIYDLTRDRD